MPPPTSSQMRPGPCYGPNSPRSSARSSTVLSRAAQAAEDNLLQAAPRPLAAGYQARTPGPHGPRVGARKLATHARISGSRPRTGEEPLLVLPPIYGLYRRRMVLLARRPRCLTTRMTRSWRRLYSARKVVLPTVSSTVRGRLPPARQATRGAHRLRSKGVAPPKRRAATATRA